MLFKSTGSVGIDAGGGEGILSNITIQAVELSLKSQCY